MRAFFTTLCALLLAVVLLVVVLSSVAAAASRIPASCATSWESPDLEALAFAPDGSIFTANFYTSQVFHYSSNGSQIASWSLPNGPKNLPFRPCGIDLDANGDVFVADRSNQCVYHCLPDGTVLDTLGFGILGYGAYISGTLGVTCDRQNGHVFVCDGHGYAIREFSPSGELIRSIPADWYITDMTFGNAGEMYVSASNWRMYRFAADGTVMTTWQPADAAFASNFTSIACGPDGRVHVVDRGRSQVIVFTEALQQIGVWSLDCSGINFQCPDGLGYNSPVLTGIDVNGRGGAVLGSDCMPNQVALFPDITVGAQSTTWGKLKSIYR